MPERWIVKNMTAQDISELILAVLAIISIGFNVWWSLKKPQISQDKKEALNNQAIEDRADVLAQQLKWQNESNERRFAELKTSNECAITLANNHTNETNVKVDNLASLVNQQGKDIIKLATIIDERIPKR